MPHLRHAELGVLSLALSASLLFVAGAANAQLPPAPDPIGLDAVYLTVDSIVVQGTGEGMLSEADILELTVDLAKVAGGWVGARDGYPQHRWKIGQLSGLGQRLYGSALRGISERIEFAHFTRGLSDVRVDVRAGTVVRHAGGEKLRNLVIELREESASRPRRSAVPAAPERYGPDAVLLTVRSVAFEGVAPLGLSESELLNLDLELAWDGRQIPPGYVSRRPGLPRTTFRIWELGRFERGGVRLYGSAVQVLLQRVARELYDRQIYGVTVDLDPGAVRRLSTPGGDGLLTIASRKEDSG